MKIFYQNGIPGYGARFYIKNEDKIKKIGDLLKIMSAWGGVDKADDRENWVSYEMPPTADYSIFKTVIDVRFPHIEICESSDQWKEFLAYCKE